MTGSTGTRPLAAPAREGEPTRGAHRIASIDVLRGFALCGIVLIHAPIFARPGAPPGWDFTGTLLDQLALFGLILFVEAKFFSLFSALFGVGFALQWRRAEQRGRPFVPLFRRRLLFLGLFGAAHIVLLWERDILLLYALVGLLLIPFRNAAPHTLLRWSAGLLLAPLAIYALAFCGLALARLDGSSAALIGSAEAQFSAQFAAARAGVVERYASEMFDQALVGRVVEFVTGLPLLLIRVPSVLALFLLGFYAGKRNLLHDVERHLPLLRQVRAWGLGVGLLASLLVTLAYSQLPPFAALTALGFNQALAGPALALGYAATLTLLLRRSWWQELLRPLASYGRMALTNYLLQSALCALLFYGYGFGLVERASPLQAIGLALAINAGLIGLSVWWLRRFQYGPAEWLWRSLTYQRWQPLRRVSQPGPGATPAPSAGSRRTGARYRDRPLDLPPSH